MMEHTTASVDAVVDRVRHVCIVDIDASYLVSGSIYVVSAYCEVLFFAPLCSCFNLVWSYKFCSFMVNESE